MIQCPDVRFLIRSVGSAKGVEEIGDLREDAGDGGRRVCELTDFWSDESFGGETGFTIGGVLRDDREDEGFDVLSRHRRQFTKM